MNLSIAAPSFAFPEEDPIAKSFTEEYNVAVEHKALASQPQNMINLFVAGDGQENYDAIYDNGGGMEDLLAGRDIISPLDTGRMSNWGDVYDDVKEGGKAADWIRYEGEVYGVPDTRSHDGITYNSDAIPSGPDSWGAFFTDEFKGEVAVLNDYSVTPHQAALYLKENNLEDIDNPSNLTRDELETVIDFLIERKQAGQFKKLWTGLGETITDLQNGEVSLGYALLPAVVALQKQGEPIEIAPMEEGSFDWNNLWMVTAGGAGRGRQEAVYRLIDWSTTPKYGADILSTRGVLPAVKTEMVREYIQNNPAQYDVEYLMGFIDNVEERIEYGGPGAHLNVAPDELEAYLDEWDRFLNA